MPLPVFTITFPLGAGWSISCEQRAHDEHNAEHHARLELLSMFPQWHEIIKNGPALIEVRQ